MFNFQQAIPRVPFAFSRLYSRALWISNSFNDISMSSVATTSSLATSSYAKPYRKVSRESTQEIVVVDSKPRERHMPSKDLKKSFKEVQQEVEKVDFDKDLACLKDDDKLMKLTVAELRGLMRKLGMPPTGRKQDLILALKNFLQSKSADQIPKNSIPKEENKFLTEFTPDSQVTHETKGQVKSLLVSSLKDSMTLACAARNDGKLQVATKNVRNNKKQCSPINRAVDVIAQQSSLQKETIVLQEPLMKIANHDCEAHTVEPIHECSEKVNIPSQTVSKKGLARTKRKATESIHKSKTKDGISAAKVEQSCNFEEPWMMLVHKKPQDGWVAYNPATMRLTSPVENTNMIRLISWNVNGLRALLRRKDENTFFQLSKTEKFDILCLQETKLQEKDVEVIKQDLLDGYEYSFWTCSVSKLGYSGTAVISRIKPLSVKFGLGVPDHDAEGRLITIELDQFYLVAGYVPNSGQKLERLTYRVQQWDPALSNYIKDLEQKKPVVLTGDLNCAHEEIDIYNPDGNRRSAGFTNEERGSFKDNFLNKGFVDSFRHQHPNSVGYTYWGYRQGARSDNRGWRLDYFLVSNSIVDNVYDSYILPEVNGSDHCPIGLILKL